MAKELGMTHKRLLRELGVGELAYWHALQTRENDRYREAKKTADRSAGGS